MQMLSPFCQKMVCNADSLLSKFHHIIYLDINLSFLSVDMFEEQNLSRYPAIVPSKSAAFIFIPLNH